MIDEMLAEPVVISRKHIDVFARMSLCEEEIEQVAEGLTIITKHVHVVTEKDDVGLIGVGINVCGKFAEDGTRMLGVDVDIGDEEHGDIVEKWCVVARGVILYCKAITHFARQIINTHVSGAYMLQYCTLLRNSSLR